MTAALHAPHSARRSAIEAALVLAVGMGFGRFAFTAIYPHMVGEGRLSLAAGSLAASVNYAGYLLGAILAIRAQAGNAHRLCLWATGGTALCLAVLALPTPAWVLVLVRGLAGLFSALAMVAASLWLLEQRRHFRGAPLLYAGVGVGIALSAELLVLGRHLGLHSGGLWLLLGAVALLIGLAAVPGLMATDRPPEPVDVAGGGVSPSAVRRWPLVLIYGLAGFGYIITATYLPLLVKTALPDLDAGHVWAVFGLGAVPSCFLWHRLHERLGTRAALCANLAVQALGVLMPVLAPSASGYLLSALLVGGTFTGTVTIAMPAAQRISRTFGGNLVATMTVVYSLGQIAGPVVANALYARGQSFTASLVTAAAALALASAMSVLAL